MKIVNLIQGSPEWHAHRAQHFNASDAPAMMSCSPYKTRSELIAELATGVTAEAGPALQRIFDAGHQFEALARPLAEDFIGEELYPVVGTEGRYSASFDGLTMLEDAAFEHKSLNKDLRAAFDDIDTVAPEYRDEQAGRLLPLAYQVQMEQQAMVSGCARILFMASKWEADRDTGEWVLIEERHCWYTPDLALRAQLVAGWAQLEKEVAAYVPAAISKVEKIIAEPVEALPSPYIRVSGELVLQDNFKTFEERLRRFLADRLIHEPKTDEDFVNLDAQIKLMKQARKDLAAAEDQMLAQVAPIDQAKKTKEMLDKLLQENCRNAERLLESEKLRRKTEIMDCGRVAFDQHIEALNQRLGKHYMPPIPTNFPGITSGLKSLSSMEGKVADELARAKIAANEVADRIQVNLTTLHELANQHAFLFADTAQIVLKASDDCTTLVKARIAEHQAAEASRLEAEREKIRAEEQAKAEAAVRAEQEAKRRAEDAEAAAARDKALQAEKDAQAAIAEAHKVDALPEPLLSDLSAVATHVRDEAIATIDAGQVIGAAKSATPTVDTDEVATMTLGQINTLIAPIKLDAAGLAELGFEAKTIKAAKHYPASDVPKILAAMVRHLQDLLVAA